MGRAEVLTTKTLLRERKSIWRRHYRRKTWWHVTWPEPEVYLCEAAESRIMRSRRSRSRCAMLTAAISRNSSVLRGPVTASSGSGSFSLRRTNAPPPISLLLLLLLLRPLAQSRRLKIVLSKAWLQWRLIGVKNVERGMCRLMRRLLTRSVSVACIFPVWIYYSI